MLHKINLKSQWRTLSFSFLITIIIVISIIFNIVSTENYTGLGAIAAVAAIYLSFSYMLYIEYLFQSVGVEFEVNLYEKSLHFKSKNKRYEYHFNEIISITKICSTPVGENRREVKPTDTFYYYLIKLERDRQIIITSLLIDYLKIQGIKTDIKKMFIPVIFPHHNKLE